MCFRKLRLHPMTRPPCLRSVIQPDALRLDDCHRVSWIDSFRLFFKISQSVKIPCIREKPRPSSKLQERNHCPPGPVQASVVASLHPRGVGAVKPRCGAVWPVGGEVARQGACSHPNMSRAGVILSGGNRPRVASRSDRALSAARSSISLTRSSGVIAAIFFSSTSSSARLNIAACSRP